MAGHHGRSCFRQFEFCQDVQVRNAPPLAMADIFLLTTTVPLLLGTLRQARHSGDTLLMQLTNSRLARQTSERSPSERSQVPCGRSGFLVLSCLHHAQYPHKPPAAAASQQLHAYRQNAPIPAAACLLLQSLLNTPGPIRSSTCPCLASLVLPSSPLELQQ